MGTCNFTPPVNVSRYYTIDEPEDGYESIEYDCVLQSIEDDLCSRDVMGKYTMFPDFRYYNDYRTIASSGYLELYDRDRKEWFGVTIYAVLSSGYYSGASLDVLVIDGSIGNGGGMMDLKEMESYCSKTAIDNIKRYIRKIERVYKDHTRQLRRVAVFSNGEAVYEEVK